MRRLEYVCSTGDSIAFDGPVYSETMPELRGRAWVYSLGSRSLSGVSWQARELSVAVKAVDGLAALDTLRALADHDVLAHSLDAAKSGLLRADGEWECRALIVKAEPQSIRPRIIESQLTVTQLSRWRRDLPTVTFAPSEQGDYEWLDFPFDFPFDYGPPSAPPVVVVDGLDAVPFRMRVHGPCSDPVVTVGGNRYMLSGDIPAGAWVEISSVEGGRTVTLVTEAGDRLNWFAHAERGAGLGSGSYIFQPLPAGRNEVSWTGGFTFEITPIEERSEPPWSA